MWPSFSVKVEVAPWHWRLWWYSDRPETSSWTLAVGPLTFEWFANRSLFPLEPRPDRGTS